MRIFGYGRHVRTTIGWTNCRGANSLNVSHQPIIIIKLRKAM